MKNVRLNKIYWQLYITKVEHFDLTSFSNIKQGNRVSKSFKEMQVIKLHFIERLKVHDVTEKNKEIFLGRKRYCHYSER